MLVIHFLINSCQWCKVCICSSFCVWIRSCASTVCKENVFAPLYCLCSSVKEQFVHLFLGCLFCHIDLLVYSFTDTILS